MCVCVSGCVCFVCMCAKGGLLGGEGREGKRARTRQRGIERRRERENREERQSDRTNER